MKRIFVGGLSSDTTEVDMKDYFGEFGEVRKGRGEERRREGGGKKEKERERRRKRGGGEGGETGVVCP